MRSPDEGPALIAEEKRELRTRMRALRARIPPQERDRMAAEIERRLLDVPVIREARTVLVFSSFGSEVPTRGIVRRLLEEGHRVLLPYLEDGSMSAAEVRRGEELVATAYGPREPPRRVPVDPGQIDAVVAPGLAFDRRGFRLGQGGGHYDRYLSSLRDGTARVGIGYQAQVIPSVPHGSGDEPLDLVVTDGEVIRCDRRPPAAEGGEPIGGP